MKKSFGLVLGLAMMGLSLNASAGSSPTIQQFKSGGSEFAPTPAPSWKIVHYEIAFADTESGKTTVYFTAENSAGQYDRIAVSMSSYADASALVKDISTKKDSVIVCGEVKAVNSALKQCDTLLIVSNGEKL